MLLKLIKVEGSGKSYLESKLVLYAATRADQTIKKMDRIVTSDKNPFQYPFQSNTIKK